MGRHLKSVSMVLAFVVGGLLHESLYNMVWWLPIGVALMLTLSFLGLDLRKMRPTLMHAWLLLVWAVLWMFFWGVPRLLGYPVFAEAMFFCAAAPVAAAIPVIICLLRGDVEFTTTAMVLSHALYALLMPLIMPLVMHDAHMGYVEMLLLVSKQLAQVLVAPVVLTVLLRAWFPKVHELAHSQRTRDFSLAVWVFNLTIISASGTHRIISLEYGFHTLWPMALGALVVCATGFLLGYRLGYPKHKRECSQALGQKNTILTLYIASQPYATPAAIIGPVFYVFFHNFANAVQVSLANRERDRKGE